MSAAPPAERQHAAARPAARSGRVVLVTGASSGIGRALARRLAASGDAVAVLARREPLLRELVQEIEAQGGRALALPCDVTEPGAMAEAVAETERRLGPIDVLVANAGGGTPTFVDDFRAAQIASTLALNVVGVARGIEAVLPGMRARGAGQLVAIGSLAGSRGLPSGAAYAASKAALAVMMESLRIDLRGSGVGVTLIEPGPVRLKPKSKKSPLVSVDVEAAAARIEAAIRRRRARRRFPAGVALAVALGRLLPIPVYDRLLAGRGRRPKAVRAKPAPRTQDAGRSAPPPAGRP